MKALSFISSLFLASTTVSADAAIYTTTKCKQFGQPEIQVSVSDKAIPSGDITFMLSNIEELVAKGERFKANQTMQFGWMITKFTEGTNGALRILEPDLKKIPVNFIDSFDNTLKILRNQKDAVESVNKDILPTFPSLVQSVIVHKNYKKSNQVLLERTTPKENDSGWWLSDLNDSTGNKNQNNFIKISLYQLAIDRPDLIKFFAFPPEFQIIVNSNQISVLKSGHEVPLLPDSYLSELNKTKR